MNIRIALISEHASPLAAIGGTDSGGQNVYVAHLAKNLAEMGHWVDVFTRRDHPNQPIVTNWLDRVRVIHVPAGPAQYVRKEDLLPCMREFRSFMDRLLRKHDYRYDIIHAHFWMSGLVAHHLKNSFQIPFVMTFHALGRIRRLYQGKSDQFPAVRVKIEDSLVAEADHVIAECPQDKKDFVQFYKADRQKVSIIPCGFDPNEIWRIDRRLARVILGLPPKENLVLQLGRMVPRKGVDTVIHGFKRLLDHHRVRAKLVVVGGESEKGQFLQTPEIIRLKELAKAEGIAGHILFRGPCPRDEVKYYYSAADIFVSMPWYEPFGITPLEAMACGVPVIGSNVGGIKFTVQDHKNGFIIPPHDVEALGDRMAYLFQRPALREMMGKIGQKRAYDRFTWAKVTKAILLIYQYVLHQRYPHKYQALESVNGDGVVFDQWKERREMEGTSRSWAGAERRTRWF